MEHSLVMITATSAPSSLPSTSITDPALCSLHPRFHRRSVSRRKRAEVGVCWGVWTNQVRAPFTGASNDDVHLRYWQRQVPARKSTRSLYGDPLCPMEKTSLAYPECSLTTTALLRPRPHPSPSPTSNYIVLVSSRSPGRSLAGGIGVVVDV